MELEDKIAKAIREAMIMALMDDTAKRFVQNIVDGFDKLESQHPELSKVKVDFYNTIIRGLENEIKMTEGGDIVVK